MQRNVDFIQQGCVHMARQQIVNFVRTLVWAATPKSVERIRSVGCTLFEPYGYTVFIHPCGIRI